MKKFGVLLLLLLFACSSAEQFPKPDIKDDFCGVHINFQYCKCAFHNEYCDSVKMSKSQANAHVQAEYNKWVDGELKKWLVTCESSGGIAGADTCTRCEEGTVVQNGKCVEPGQTVETSSMAEFTPDRPLRKDCTVDAVMFESDWKKYSDIDEAIPFNERSFEAKQTVTLYDEMIDKMVEAFALERDVEIENQMQLELEQYRTALVNNIKTNLLKSFWRLSWVTYTTVQTGKGLGESFSQVLVSGASVETLGAGLKVVQGVIPSDSVLAIDTSTISGKAKSVGASVALEAIDTLGDPVKVATELFKSVANAPLPSADLTEEEINILKEQHLNKGIIDKALAESRAENSAREAKLAQLEVEISGLQKEIAGWEVKEKERVERSLEAGCLELKKKFEK